MTTATDQTPPSLADLLRDGPDLYAVVQRSKYAGEGAFYRLVSVHLDEAECDAACEPRVFDGYCASSSCLEEAVVYEPGDRLARLLRRGELPRWVNRPYPKLPVIGIKGVRLGDLDWCEERYLTAVLMLMLDGLPIDNEYA